MNSKLSLTEAGRFIVGCNYWASHAGTAMWADWRPEVVERDLKKLAAAGLQVLRVFPLWPDFQPLTLLRQFGGRAYEFRHGEEPLAEDPTGQAGVSVEAMRRFAQFADRAEHHGLKLMVGLITGWMSGRLFVPPALEGRNVLTDPMAVMWQVRFVRCFAKQFFDHPAILAWDLGNECDCMGTASREEAWTWTAAIVHAIRSVDSHHPVVSGMHGLRIGTNNSWRIVDQAELTDVLTTHPYPSFTPHCDQDPVNTIRPGLHATAESRLYADAGGKPCLVEEVGTLGPMFANEKLAADFARSNLFSTWAHDCHGWLWWCAFDQSHLEHAPYDWCAVERELGLFRVNGSPKPVLKEMTAFRNFLKSLPFQTLPPRVIDAVCVLSDLPDHWAVAFSAFILAKQAGLDIRFCDGDRTVPESSLYLLPSTSGGRILGRRQWLNLMARVHQGATLYISNDDGLFSGFEEMTGLQVNTRRKRSAPSTVTIDIPPNSWSFENTSRFGLHLTATRAQVLGREDDGNPAFTCVRHGQGRVYFLNCPIELQVAQQPGAFHGDQRPPFWKIYHILNQHNRISRVISRIPPCIGVTEHPFNRTRRLIIMINYSPSALEIRFSIKSGWRIGRVYHGERLSRSGNGGHTRLKSNDALVFLVQRV